MTPASDIAAQLDRAQQLLVDFLRVDLDLAFSLLKTAEIARAANHKEHEQKALAKVREALSTIRHLTKRILDPQSRGEIDAKVREFESALAAERLSATSLDRHRIS
jgi:hypothetical protein